MTTQNDNGDRPKNLAWTMPNRPTYKDSNSMSLDQIEMISILIVDDSEIIREGLKSLLGYEADFEIVATTDNSKTAIALIEKLQPDIALVNLELPELDGISTTRIIKERFPQTKVIVLSSHDNYYYFLKSLEAGARSYLVKQMETSEIQETIRTVYRGYIRLESQLLEPLLTAAMAAKSEAELTATIEPQESALTASSNDSEIVEYEEEQVLIPQKPAKSRFLVWTVVAFTSLSISIIAFAIAKLLPSISAQLSSPPPTPPSPPAAKAIPEPTAVSALGRLEPEGEVVQVSASSASEAAKVEQLLVKQGDKVRQGQAIAILDSYSPRQAALEKAKTDVQIAQANLAKVKAGAKTGDINAQKEAIARLQAELEGQTSAQTATIDRLKAELNNANVEYRRHLQLYQEGAISASELDTRRLRVDTVKEQLNEAEETLNRLTNTIEVQRNEAEAKLASISEVRTVDVQVAQAELNQAIANVKQAQADLNLASVVSPINGQVLQINVRPGEVISDEGIAAIGQTNQMYVVAEVYETDIERVKVGQKAAITGAAFSQKLSGKVTQIGLEVDRQNVFNADPLVNTDNKVIEVKIRLDPKSSTQVAGLSNLQVQTVIHLNQ
jgi:HlyD family secretion protein